MAGWREKDDAAKDVKADDQLAAAQDPPSATITHRQVDPPTHRQHAEHPSLIAYAVTDKGKKSYWTRIGVAYTNRDGSITVKLDAVPVNGVLQLRADDPRRAGSRV